MSPAFTEIVEFKRYGTTSDGAGGLKNSDSPIALGSFFAKIREKPYSRFVEGQKLSFRNAYEVEIWRNPEYEPREGDIIEHRGKSLVIQEISQDPLYRKYILKTVAKT